MKKILAILLTIIVMCSFSGCSMLGELPSLMEEIEKMTDGEDSDDNDSDNNVSEQNTTAGGEQGDSQIEESKTLQLFREVMTGDFTLEYNAYSPDIEGNEKFSKTIGSINIHARKGEKQYRYQSDGQRKAEAKSIVDGEKLYGIFDDSQMVMVEKYYPSRENKKYMDTFGDSEEDYYNMIGDPQTIEVWGKSYYAEHFGFDAKSVTYLYEGDTLKYMINERGGVDYLLEIICLQPSAPDEYFEIPANYEVYGY